MSRWTVFLLCVLVVGVLAAVVVFTMGLPPCENPPESWLPCIGP